MDPAALTDDEAFPEVCGGQSGRKTSLSIGSLDVLSVNQLLESVSCSLSASIFVVCFYKVFLVIHWFMNSFKFGLLNLITGSNFPVI